ncbi:MAG: hypothetical protein AB7G93_17505 [Bdellovibrionales bacterium]
MARKTKAVTAVSGGVSQGKSSQVKKATTKTPVTKGPVDKGSLAAAKKNSPAKAALVRHKAALKSVRVTVQGTGPSAADVVKAPVKTRARKLTVEINPNEAATALAQKWVSLYRKSEQIEAKPYNMNSVFEEKTAIMHKILGWGYILANRNDRLEVLFKDGIRYLISNYKP